MKTYFEDILKIYCKTFDSSLRMIVRLLFHRIICYFDICIKNKINDCTIAYLQMVTNTTPLTCL